MKTLGLQTCRLNKPLSVLGVFASKRSESERLLSQYVKLVIISSCSQWQSCSQVFIVCPNLHTDMILGLDFLQCNKLIINPEKESIMDGSTSFNLLHPSDPVFARKPVTENPHVRCKRLKDKERAEKEWIRQGQEEMKGPRQLIYFELNALFTKQAAKLEERDDSGTACDPVLLELVHA